MGDGGPPGPGAIIAATDEHQVTGCAESKPETDAVTHFFPEGGPSTVMAKPTDAAMACPGPGFAIFDAMDSAVGKNREME